MVLGITSENYSNMTIPLVQLGGDPLRKNTIYKYIYNNNLYKMLIYELLLEHLRVFLITLINLEDGQEDQDNLLREVDHLREYV